MKIAEELARFIPFAEKQGMDLSGDNIRFVSPIAAAAWTKWLEEAKAFELGLEDDKQTGPRVTLSDIEANITGAHYFTAADGVYGDAHAHGRGLALPNISPLNLLTFCVLVLRNGFTVTGESACVSQENFNEEAGRKVAREKAVQKVWQLMGYALKNQLAQPSSTIPRSEMTGEQLRGAYEAKAEPSTLG